MWAEHERLLDKADQRMPVENSYVAATAQRHGLTIATGNERDFKRPGRKAFNDSLDQRQATAAADSATWR